MLLDGDKQFKFEMVRHIKFDHPHVLAMFYPTVLILLQTLVRGQHDHHQHLIGSQNRDWRPPIEIEVHGLHKNCQYQGFCVYSPPGCHDNDLDYQCKQILMIRKYSPPCEPPKNEGNNIPRKNMTQDLCSRKKHLFSFTLVTTLSIPVSRNYRIYIKGGGRANKWKIFGAMMGRAVIFKPTTTPAPVNTNVTQIRCQLQPFVAVAFSDNDDPAVTPTEIGGTNGNDTDTNNATTITTLGDVFYVCVPDEPYVTAWIKPTTPPMRTKPNCLDDSEENPKFDRTTPKPASSTYSMVQLKDTQPYPPMAPSVMWSKIVRISPQFAMGCKFLLSNLEKDLTMTLNGTNFTVPVFNHTFIKIASGLAYVKNSRIEDLIFGTTSEKALAISPNLMDNANIDVSPGVTDWDDEIMDYPVEKTEVEEEEKLGNELHQKIPELYRKCNQRKALCYVRQDESDCILRQRCHFLALIEFTSKDNFKTMRIHMMVQKMKRRGVDPHLIPQFWGAIAFSNDTQMGDDLVIACYSVGTESHIRPFLNTDQNSVEIDEDHASFIIKPLDEIRISVAEEIMICAVDVDTTNASTFRSFDHSSRWSNPVDESTWNELYFDFQKHAFHILIAQGSKVYQNRITYHNYAGVAGRMFSKKLFLDRLQSSAANSTFIHAIYCMSWLCNIMLFIVAVFLF